MTNDCSQDAARGVRVVQHIFVEDMVEGDGVNLKNWNDGCKKSLRFPAEDGPGEWMGN
jgi:hypothetical protein